MGAVLVLPASPAGQQGPVAALVSGAGWLGACRRVLGEAWMVTPDGLLEPAEALRLASASELAPPSARARVAAVVPTVAKTAIKDLRQWRRGSRFRVGAHGPWSGSPVDFVWQRHELFHTCGVDLAQQIGAPSVVFAPVTPVWEARRWGVNRPGWAGLTERLGESPTLRRATLVACGSEEVAEQAERLGASPERILVTPTGVDHEAFDRPGARDDVRRRLGVSDDFVVGWVGSFRPFHAVHRLVEAVAGMPSTTLLLVGDGPERPAVEARAAELGVRVVATGTVGHGRLVDHLAAMDAAVVVAPDDGAYHYSPLKLAEYLAAGLPVVAPSVPTVASRLVDEHHVLLVAPGDGDGLRKAITRLREDEDLRSRLAHDGREEARLHWSWDEQVRRVVARLGELA